MAAKHTEGQRMLQEQATVKELIKTPKTQRTPHTQGDRT